MRLKRIPALIAALLLTGAVEAEAPLSGKDVLAAVQDRVKDITTAELEALIAAHPNAAVIDVRTRGEIVLTGGSIDAPRHYNIPRGWLEFRIQESVPAPDTPIVVYCGVNERSPLAAETLSRMGYRDVRNYPEGFFAWRDAGLPVESADQAVDSVLYRKPEQVSPNVWSAIGATAPPTYENSGHNNNLSFIVTEEGVVVVNAGDNWLLAKALHEEIRKVTDQPVKHVILENGQGHAMLGSNYWKEQGATIIAHVDAAHEIETRGADIIASMRQGRRDKAVGTELTMPDVTFEDRHVIELGGERIEVLHLGPAHSPGDISVWLPKQKLVIAGDIAFHQRMLPVFEDTDTAAWIETWPAFEALGAETVIPGHGDPTDMATVTRYTRDYLSFLRGRIQELLDAGGTLQDAYQIDQSAYRGLDTYDELARLNAGRVFRAMEFE
jgi:glyoxylase-like metal-dependent hydrolase (beta-lactamase superfamily II)/rhodanese-related sulfurtransferase